MSLQWVTFIEKSAIPVGQREVFDTDYGSILLININGEIYAIENLCSHEAYELHEGILEACKIECPKHGAWFDLQSGTALTLPATRPIKIFQTRIHDDNIQVQLNITD